MTAKTTTFPTIAGLNKALRKLPKEATVELRNRSVVIAAREADKAKSEATSQGGLAALVAPSIRSTRDRVPKISMGNSKRLPARNGRARSGPNQTIGNVIWGAEFGGQRRETTQQFKPWLGHTGHFLYPTIRADSDEIHAEYSDALLDALKEIK